MPTLPTASCSTRKTIPLLMMVVACGHFNRIAMSVVGTERLIPDYGISPEKMGLVYSAFLLPYTLLMLPGGLFIDRFGARTALVLQCFGSAVFVAITGLVRLFSYETATLWLVLVITRAFLGGFNAPLHPAAARTVFDRFPANSRSLANGLVTFSACVGIAATYYVMGGLIDILPWQFAFLITAGLTLAVAIVWTLGMPASKSSDAHQEPLPTTAPFQAGLRILRSRSVVCLTLSYTALNYTQNLFFYWIQYYFESIQHQDPVVARSYAAMITLAMGIGMVAGGWLSDRVSHSLSPQLRRAIVPMFGMVGCGSMFELGLMTSDARIILCLFTLAAALLGACEGIFWTTAVELGGRFGGAVAGLMNMGGNTGGTLSPYLTPLLGTVFARYYGPELGWRLSLAIAGGAIAAGAMLWIGIRTDDQELLEPPPAPLPAQT